jgi:hypothetical protein
VNLLLIFFLTLFGYWLIRPMKMGTQTHVERRKREKEKKKKEKEKRAGELIFLQLFIVCLLCEQKGVFVSLVGLESEPAAKLGTVVILVPMLMAYNQLVVVLQSPKRLVLVVGTFYAVVFAGISISLLGTDTSQFKQKEEKKQTTERK